jgi:catechol 2,3-dioxygenase-like lactoylglutathione lyase family enzyme
MPTFTVQAFNHTSFTVIDIDRTVSFLCDCLGFELINKTPRDPRAIEHITGVTGADVIIAFVQGPGHRLELIQYLKPEERKQIQGNPCDTAFAHVAFDVDDIDAAIAAAADYDVVPYATPWVIDQGPNTGNRVAYLKTWDGITLEFIEKAHS